VEEIRMKESEITRKPGQLHLIEGGLYANPRENGNGYRIIKILKIDEYAYHVRMYSNRFQSRPEDINEDTLYMSELSDYEKNWSPGMEHMPIHKENFENWKLTFIKQVEVTSEELEGYRLWEKDYE
jgi:hypothetical protein